MNRLLTGKQVAEKLNIGADTLKKLRNAKGAAFPGYFWSKYYSEPEIDAWLRSRLNEQQKQSLEFDINAAADEAIGEMFGSSLSPHEPTSSGSGYAEPAPLKLAE